VKAPIKKGEIVADMVVKLADGTEQVTPLVASADVNQAGYFRRIWNGVKAIFGA
jgi:serine-type D-Ala-D-Ala carboxypeptidase (penicillin-binding protein 5/6)